MDFQDDEIENYQAKYGCIEINDHHFDDHPELGFDYLQYKISKIKIWTAKKGELTAIAGIQTFYINNRDGSEFVSEENKGEKVDKNSFVEFILKNNEYINGCDLWFEEGVIYKLKFKTNLKNIFEIGDPKGEKMEVDELSKNKMVLSFFGTYGSNYLTSIGLFINKVDEFFDYFIRGYFELKIFLQKEKNNEIIEKNMNEKKYDLSTISLIKVSKLPSNVFHEVLKFICPI